MHPDLAQLSSIATALDDLSARVTGIADRQAADPVQEAVARDLYDVERSLQTAARRLSTLLRRLE